MGVQRLTTFAREHKRDLEIYKQVNILDEIRLRHRLNSDQKPTVIFDVMGFVHNFGGKVELNLGGRQHNYIRTFERFIQKLKGAGASLAFICDGQLQADKNDEWCRRRNDEYRGTIDAMTNRTVEGGENVNVQSFLKKRHGCKTIAKSLLKLIDDKRYGDVIISTRVDCDLTIAKYAIEHSALAVVANDSDFLIFDGDFQWWDANSMDMNRMTVNRYDRAKLMNMLNLTSKQMRYLATIAGNDHTKHLLRKSPNFVEIAMFCEPLHEPCQQVYRDIVNFMQFDTRMDMNEAIDLVAKSVKWYDVDAVDLTSIEIDKMDEYCASNVLMYAFRNQKVFQYELNFVEFNATNQLERMNKNNNNNNNARSFVDIVLEVFRKLAGIMLKNTDHRNATLKIVTKYSNDDGYTLKLHTPIYPQGFIDYDNILFGNSMDFDETKWKLLLWSLGLDAKFRFRTIPKKYVPTVLTLAFMLQIDEITLMMADTVLIAQYHIEEMNLSANGIRTDVSNIRTESVRIGHMFNRVNTLIWDCLMVCGLKTFIQLDWYDGPYFNHLLQKFQKSDREYKENIQPINEYRIYTKLMPENKAQ